MFKFALLFGFIVAASKADTLQHLQILYRHGDRAPEGTYKNDPYQESAWPVSWGELTDTGMQQHFIQGSKVQEKYMINNPYLPKDYKSKDIHVRSTDVDRTLVSAYSHLVGLYSASNGTYPSIQNWPTKFSPIPVHTVDSKTDHILNADPPCLRMDELEAEQVAHGKFVQYMAAQLPLLLEISEKSGEKITDVKGLKNFYDAITIERIHNMTLPTWITDNIFNQVKTIVETCEDYIFGSAGFGKSENSELIKLKGGLLLQEMISHMDNNGGVKLYMYSAHDTTVAAFLRTLEAKEGRIIGSVSPDFAATVAVELWLASDNSQYVKLWYSDNANTDFRDVTQTIGNCGGGNKCAYNAFKERSQKYLPGDIEKACDKL